MTKRMHGLLVAGGVMVAALISSARGYGQAQPAAEGPGTYVAIGGTVSAFRNPYGQRDIAGGTLYADVNPTWRYGFELEGRSLRYHTDEDVKMQDYFAGIRVRVRPGRISPYGKFLVGAGKITLPFDYAHGTFFTLVPGAGLDIRLNDRFTLRPVDFEYQMWQKFPYGNLRPYGVSAGLSFRLNPISLFPRHAYYSRAR